VAGFQRDSTSLTIATMIFLEEWLTNHFLGEDARFVKFMTSYVNNINKLNIPLEPTPSIV
jgi:hemerythrin